MQAAIDERTLCVPCAFASDEAGAISILGAAFIVVFIALAAITVDAGYFIHQQYRLQSAADNAALAPSLAPDRAAEIVRASLDDNGFADALVNTAEEGTYLDDPSLAPGSRFSAGTPANAVHVATTYAAPTFFSRSLLGSSMNLHAEATAQNLPIAGFTALPDLFNLDANSVASNLSDVTGSAITLSNAELAGLGNTSVDLLDLAEQLGNVEGTPNATVQSIFSSAVGLADLAQALHDAISNEISGALTTDQLNALDALDRLASTAGNANPVNLGDLVDITVHDARTLASLASSGNGTGAELVRPIDALVAFAQAGSGDQKLSYSKTISVGGTGVTVEIISARPSIMGTPARSPMAAAGPVGTSVYEPTTRLRLTAGTAPITLPLLGTLSLNVPIIVELGYGQATLSSISCGSDIASTTDVGITAQSGLAKLYIGNVSNADFEDFSKPLNPSSASILNDPLLSIDGTSSAALATSQEILHFSRSDISAGTAKSVGSLDTSQAASDLAGGLKISGTIGSLAAPIVQPAIATLVQAVAGLLPSTLGLSGVGVGTMDVTATSVRCGVPVLVR